MATLRPSQKMFPSTLRHNRSSWCMKCVGAIFYRRTLTSTYSPSQTVRIVVRIWSNQLTWMSTADMYFAHDASRIWPALNTEGQHVKHPDTITLSRRTRLRHGLRVALNPHQWKINKLCVAFLKQLNNVMDRCDLPKQILTWRALVQLSTVREVLFYVRFDKGQEWRCQNKDKVLERERPLRVCSRASAEIFRTVRD